MGPATSWAFSSPYKALTSCRANSRAVPGPLDVMTEPSTTTRWSTALQGNALVSGMLTMTPAGHLVKHGGSWREGGPVKKLQQRDTPPLVAQLLCESRVAGGPPAL